LAPLLPLPLLLQALYPSAVTDLTANGVTGTNAVVTWWTGSGGTGTNLGSTNPLVGAVVRELIMQG